MKKLLISILLFLTAIIIYVVIAPSAIIHIFIKLIIKKDFKQIPKYLEVVFMQHAIGIDQIGNGAYSEFFNDVFIKDKTIHPFGNIDETISSVIGKNKLINNLRIEGKILDFILSLFDDNHSVKSIEN